MNCIRYMVYRVRELETKANTTILTGTAAGYHHFRKEDILKLTAVAQETVWAEK